MKKEGTTYIVLKYPHFLSVWTKFDTFLIGNILSKKLDTSWSEEYGRLCIIILSKLSPVKMEIHRTEIYIKFSHKQASTLTFVRYQWKLTSDK
jgi:hypothetical protein